MNTAGTNEAAVDAERRDLLRTMGVAAIAGATTAAVCLTASSRTTLRVGPFRLLPF